MTRRRNEDSFCEMRLEGRAQLRRYQDMCSRDAERFLASLSHSLAIALFSLNLFLFLGVAVRASAADFWLLRSSDIEVARVRRLLGYVCCFTPSEPCVATIHSVGTSNSRTS
jgi:hypothetical protein